jgi:membrane protein DedA with SNARE-associated domain
MESSVEQLLVWLSAAPAAVVYLVLGTAAALENVFPPIPADVVVLFGGVVAGEGGASAWLVFLAVWIGNVAGALLVFLLGRRYGEEFFAGRWGRLLLRPSQLAQLDGFYRRYGFRVIFVSRFLPMFRAVVPAFAGVAKLGFWRTAAPMAAASGMWYGMIVYLGAAAGRNWRDILRSLSDVGSWLWIAALAVTAAVAWWWWRSRRTSEGR